MKAPSTVTLYRHVHVYVTHFWQSVRRESILVKLYVSNPAKLAALRSLHCTGFAGPWQATRTGWRENDPFIVCLSQASMLTIIERVLIGQLQHYELPKSISGVFTRETPTDYKCVAGKSEVVLAWFFFYLSKAVSPCLLTTLSTEE